MTADELREAEQKHRDSRAFYEQDREARNRAFRQALAEGWKKSDIAAATGLTRGRIGQILNGQ